MKTFPMFLKMADRRVVIAGGGEQAAQKARLILKTEAEITLCAPELDAELRGLVAAGQAKHHATDITPATFQGTALSFVATGCPGADAALHDLAKLGGAVVNVVDQPDLCDAITPSIVDRDPVVVAIGTEGTAPVLARRIKTEVEQMLPPRLGGLAALAGRLRGAVAENLPQATRRSFWAWVFSGAPARMHAAGHEDAATRLLKKAIADRAVPKGAGEGHIALVGAGPGARDLLTMRAIARLQEADVIFYDRLVEPEVLELARRDAERVFVGKEVGANAWPQDKICNVILAEARKGRRVVRLKSGDPSIFGRATEELHAARALGIEVEIVPGVTAASAAASSLGDSLTERGASGTLVLTTGTCQPGDPAPHWAHHIRAGTTLAIYMGVRSATEIRDTLLDLGGDGGTKVDVVANASKADEHHVASTLAAFPEDLAEAGILGCAVILVRFSKAQSMDLAKAS